MYTRLLCGKTQWSLPWPAVGGRILGERTARSVEQRHLKHCMERQRGNFLKRYLATLLWPLQRFCQKFVVHFCSVVSLRLPPVEDRLFGTSAFLN